MELSGTIWNAGLCCGIGAGGVIGGTRGISPCSNSVSSSVSSSIVVLFDGDGADIGENGLKLNSDDIFEEGAFCGGAAGAGAAGGGGGGGGRSGRG